MAQQQLFLFEANSAQIGHTNAHTYKAAIVDNTIVPTVAMTPDTDAPCWSSGAGKVDFSANEVSVGGNYALGGIDIQGSFSRTGGITMFDGAANPYWAAAAGAPSNCYWMIIYNDSLPDKPCVGFVQLASDATPAVPLDNTSDNISYTFAATGIYRKVTKNPAAT